jgi:hypothetical protein
VQLVGADAALVQQRDGGAEVGRARILVSRRPARRVSDPLRADPGRPRSGQASQIEALAGDKTPVLCCFESVAKIIAGEWCHRHLAALWLSHHLGSAASPCRGHGRQ